MKLLLIGLTLIVAVIADVSELDSATQGPNPQDIATPEPEYIDIDLPPPPSRPIAAAAPVQRFSAPIPAPIFRSAPVQHQQHQLYLAPHRPVHIPISNHLTQQLHHHTAPGHSYDSNGYRYKTVRRLKYRYRY